MDILGLRRIPINRIKVPGDFKQRIGTARVVSMARTIANAFMVYPPIVRKDYTLIDGADRVAAHWYLKKTDIQVLWVDCTDREAQLIRGVTSAARRHSEEERRNAEALYQKYINAATPDPEPPKERKVSKHGKALGRSPTARTIEQQRRAASLGLSLAAVRARDHRAKRDGKLPPEPVILDTLGMPIDPAELMKVSKAQQVSGDVADHIKAALALLTRQVNLELPGNRGKIERLRTELAGLGEMARQTRLASICPYCKGVEGLQDMCGGCGKSGYVSKIELERAREVHPILFDTRTPRVLTAGKLRLLAEFVEAPIPEEVSPETGEPIAEDEEALSFGSEA